jgi:alpha-tubulin suppressor-like RCC1 family protein
MTAGATLYCWGSSNHGALGVTDDEAEEEQVQVFYSSSNFDRY